MRSFPIRLTVLLIALLAATHRSPAQTAYFIDGYHGGIYGHLPPWQTAFMVEKLAQYPDWKINLELEPESWDTIAMHDPASYAAFRQLFADQSVNGRIEYINPAYGQSYMYNISGESIIRQLYYGIKKLRQHFPTAVFSTYSSEEPCFTSALPQILRSYGFQYASLKNPNTCWGGYTRAFGGELVNWIGPDGTGILAVPRYAVESLRPNSTWETIAASNSREYVQKALAYGIPHPVGMCLQDAGWAFGPWLRGANTVTTQQSPPHTTGTQQSGADPAGQSPPTISSTNTANSTYAPTVYQTWRGYISTISPNASNASNIFNASPSDWHFSQEDVLVSLMWGSQVLQRIAREVRSAENKIITAEKLAAFASVWHGAPWPGESLDKAWRTLLLSQHHDCWIVPYNGQPGDTWADKVVAWTGNTIRRSDSITAAALYALADTRPGSSPGPARGPSTGSSPRPQPISSDSSARSITVVNTTAIPRDEYVRITLPAGWQQAVIRDEQGIELPIQPVAPVVAPDAAQNVAQNVGADVAPDFVPKDSTAAGTEIIFKAQCPPMGYTTYRLFRQDASTSVSVRQALPATRHTLSTTRPALPATGPTLPVTNTRLSPTPARSPAAPTRPVATSAHAHAIYHPDGSWTLETDLYRILLDPRYGGAIRSWIDKKSGKEFVAKGQSFNALRGNFYNDGGFRTSTGTRAGIRILENGPFEIRAEISGSIAGHPFVQVITAQQGRPRVDARLTIRWRSNTAIGEYFEVPKNEQVRKAWYDDRYKLLALFPLRLAGQKVYKDAPYDVLASRLDNTFFNRWDSIKNNVLLHWVDVTDKAGSYGMALLCNHTTSYAHGKDFPLGLTVQYSGNGIFYRDYTIDGPTEIDYAWIPHRGNWDKAGLWTEGTKWNEPLLTWVSEAGTRQKNNPASAPPSPPDPEQGTQSLLRVTGSGYEISALTCNGDDLQVRLFNAEGDASPRKIYLGFAAAAVAEIALNGDKLRDIPIQTDPNGQTYLDWSQPRFGIRTLQFIKAQTKKHNQ